MRCAVEVDEMPLKNKWSFKIPVFIRTLCKAKMFLPILVSIQITLLAANLFFLEIPTYHWTKVIFIQTFLVASFVLLGSSSENSFFRVDLSRVWLVLSLVAIGSIVTCLGSDRSTMWDETHFLMVFPSHNSAGFFFGSLTVLCCVLPSARYGQKLTLLIAFAILMVLAGSRSAMVGTGASLVLWLFLNRKFRIKEEVLSFSIICLILLLNYVHPIYFPVEKVRSQLTSFVSESVGSQGKRSEKEEIIKQQQVATINVREVEEQRQDQASRNVSTRIDLWKHILSRPLSYLFLGDLNYQCDVDIRFSVNPGEGEEVRRKGDYECEIEYFDRHGYRILNTAHNILFHILAKYGFWGLIFYSISAAYILVRLWPRGNKLDQSKPSLYIFVYAMAYGIGTAGVLSFMGSLGLLIAVMAHRVELVAEEK